MNYLPPKWIGKSALALAGMLASGPLAAADPAAAPRPTHPAAQSPPPAASSPLDDELLKDLDNKLLEGPHDKPGEKTPEKTPPKPAETPAKPPIGDRKPEDPLDEQLRKSLGEGEDLGSAGEDVGENQLARIVRRMRAVEQRLADSKSDAATQQAQQQIAADLAALINELKTKQQQSQSGSRSPGSSRTKTSQPQNEPGKSTTGATDSPVRNSSNKLRPNRTDRPDAAAARELMTKALDRLNLPEKQREQMLQAPPDDFLPNYEFSTKRYFERLIEEESDNP
jgi:hypothetical protein